MRIYIIEGGITLGDGTVCLPAKLSVIEESETPLVQLIIHEGKYHQIKRMFAAAGNEVTSLKRTAMGGLLLDESLAPGECRLITKKELNLITEE